MKLRAQRRAFMTPPVGTTLRFAFAEHYRGRVERRRDTMLPQHVGMNTDEYVGHTPAGAMEWTTRRLPDIEDPRPPIIGFQNSSQSGDGSLPWKPVPNTASPGRKIMQGLYKEFKEMYNQHTNLIPLYGGCAWTPKATAQHCHFSSRASISGACEFIRANVMPGAVIRGDLNTVYVGNWVSIMEGCVIVTDGHPLNAHLPGRLNKINEGSVYIGSYVVIHPNVFIDSAYVANYCEIGEGCKLGYNSIMEQGSALEPGSVLLANQRVPQNEVWGGNPARKVGTRGMKPAVMTGHAERTYTCVTKPLMEEETTAPTLSALRSSQRIQYNFDKLYAALKDSIPEKIKEYIRSNTREIPLWEEYRNTSRVNVRTGLRTSFIPNVESAKARWYDKN